LRARGKKNKHNTIREEGEKEITTFTEKKKREKDLKT